MATQIEEQKKTDIKDLPTITWDPRKEKPKKPVGTGRGDCLDPPCGDKPNVSGKKGKSKNPVAGATKMAPKKPKRKPKKPKKTAKMPKPDSKVGTSKIAPLKILLSDKEKIFEVNKLCTKILQNIKVVGLPKIKHPWHKNPIPGIAIRIGSYIYVPLPDKNSKLPKKSSGSAILDKLGKKQHAAMYLKRVLNSKKIPTYRKFIIAVPMLVYIFHSMIEAPPGNDIFLKPKFKKVTGQEAEKIRNYLLVHHEEIRDLFATTDSLRSELNGYYFSGDDYDANKAEALELYFGSWISGGSDGEDDETDEADEADTPKKQQETKIMNQDDIKKLIKEAFTDRVYGKYPYSHQAGEEGEPKEDYQEQWKSFCLQMVQDKTKERAIAIAKLLIKDIELFEDVLDLAGQNQSIGSEILRKIEDSSKNML